ncbi:MAG: hypothetical protein SGPRY_013033 [Prymnesium sp.]
MPRWMRSTQGNQQDGEIVPEPFLAQEIPMTIELEVPRAREGAVLPFPELPRWDDVAAAQQKIEDILRAPPDTIFALEDRNSILWE